MIESVACTINILLALALALAHVISGLYHKHVMIINYASSGVNKLKASLNDDTRVVIYDRHMFTVQATVMIILETTFWSVTH
jgi:hypothetical protein